MTREHEPWDDADVAAMFTPIDGASARCPAPELLSAARAETLPSALQTHVSDHLAACVACRALADALEDETVSVLQPDEAKRILDRLRPQIAPTRSWRWTVAERALASAAVLLAAIAAWRIVQPQPREVTPATHVPMFEIASAPILPSDAQGPTATAQRPPEERIAVLEALVPYREGDYERAATSFGALIAQHPRSAAGHFYLGMSELMRGDQARAVAALGTASRLEIQDTPDAAEMVWYLAVAHYRAGSPNLAAAPLQRLCSGGSIRAEPACSVLRTLSRPRTLRATVTDTSGTPLSGVLVGEHTMTRVQDLVVFAFTEFSGRTDATGRIEVSGRTLTRAETLLVRASKPGYFTSAVDLRDAPEMEHRFTLRPWVMTAVNQTIRGTTALDAWCESNTEPCQRYAVTAPRNGRLEVSVTTTAFRQEMDLWVEMPSGEIYGPDERSPLRLELDAVAGTTYELRVLSLRGPRDFELSIQLK